MTDQDRPVPRFEPEVIAAAAKKKYRGDDEKVATTPINELVVDDVSLTSRYDKADEFEKMRKMVQGVKPGLRRHIESVWCDSKCTNCYEVTLRSNISAVVAKSIGRQMERASDGHNGIFINRPGGEEVHLDPWWGEP